MSRRDTILSMFDSSGFGLEIGPSYNPLLPKSMGYTVETIDYADQETLVAKYRDNATVDIARIEPVDHVSDGRSMVEVIGEGARYDFIVASHVIEHTPDLIGFLKDCESLLKADGVLVLAVPDKRCCFDVFQRLTGIGEVLDAHRARRRRPSFGCIFDEIAYGVKQDGATGWPKGRTGERRLVRSLGEAHAFAVEAERHGRYVDVHVWRFVPASFELILNDLFEIGETALRIAEMTVMDEFLVVLGRGAPGPSRTRLALLGAMLEEHAYEQTAGLDRAIAGLEAERDAERDAAARALAILQREADAARDERDAAARALEILRREADAARDEREATAQALEILQREAGAVREEREAARERQARAEAEAAALRASTSWRMTAPFRRVSAGLRKMLAGAAG